MTKCAFPIAFSKFGCSTQAGSVFPRRASLALVGCWVASSARPRTYSCQHRSTKMMCFCFRLAVLALAGYQGVLAHAGRSRTVHAWFRASYRQSADPQTEQNESRAPFVASARTDTPDTGSPLPNQKHERPSTRQSDPRAENIYRNSAYICPNQIPPRGPLPGGVHGFDQLPKFARQISIPHLSSISPFLISCPDVHSKPTDLHCLPWSHSQSVFLLLS